MYSRSIPIFILSMLIAISRLDPEPNLSISSEPYIGSRLFTCPILPSEGDQVRITVRAGFDHDVPENSQVGITLCSSSGRVVFKRIIALDPVGGDSSTTWTAEQNGLYTLRAELDPINMIIESNETDNTVELVLPVVAKSRRPHFVWYRMPDADVRWATCITAADEDFMEQLSERGVTALKWEYGGMPWNYYDKNRELENQDELLAELEEIFYLKYSAATEMAGFGVDESGGYPGSMKLARSLAAMRALARAKVKMPERIFAVWNSGGLDPELAALYRGSVDFLVFEAYVFYAIPNDLGTEDIYQTIRDRMDPYIRSKDMLTPAYGNPCYSLIALDTSTYPENIDPGEQEQVVRFIRRTYPEIRGMAWYNGTYRSNVEGEEANRTSMENADLLCYRYFIMPCITFMNQSLWITQDESGAVLTAAISNIGAVDSGTVTVEFLMDGNSIGDRSVSTIPAGPNRNLSRILLKLPLIDTGVGFHSFEARIVSAPESTILDSSVKCDRFISSTGQ